MLKRQPHGPQAQAGFTLVELAIVMIIIGLLIGGVLKGQALIENAQVTSTVAQEKGIEAATTTFKDTYNALPGDMIGPSTRLPNCTGAPCSTAGNGDGRLTNAPATAPSTAAAEGHQFFVHLNAASLLSGIVPGTDVFGGNFPAGKISGTGFFAGGTTGLTADLAGQVGTVLPEAGTYLVLTASPTVVPGGAGTQGLKPDQAFRIDTKLDDGSPDTGSVRGYGGGATICGTAGAAGVGGGTYNTVSTNNTCGLYMHIQG